MRALIVDDEPLARRGLALRLRRINDIEIVGECENGFDALEKITQLSPDVVFLDVQMPGMNGFDVLRSLPRQKLPAVIFLTAYEEHAVRAFEVHALDYLLKPIRQERLLDAIARARNLIGSSGHVDALQRLSSLLARQPEEYPENFAVRAGSHVHIVRASEVDWIASAGDYVELHVRGRVHLVRETMQSFEHRLNPTEFLRIHRCRIVRTATIAQLVLMDNREYTIRLSDGSDHRSSRRYADALESWLNMRSDSRSR